jgi:hypothetical protein
MWGVLKEILVEFSGVSKDALHVHIGLIAFFASTFLLKRPAASLLPWLVVLGLELGNEYLDLFIMRNRPPRITQWGESLRDLFNTMLWPTILMFAAKARQRRLLVMGRRDLSPAPSI